MWRLPYQRSRRCRGQLYRREEGLVPGPNNGLSADGIDICIGMRIAGEFYSKICVGSVERQHEPQQHYARRGTNVDGIFVERALRMRCSQPLTRDRIQIHEVEQANLV